MVMLDSKNLAMQSTFFVKLLNSSPMLTILLPFKTAPHFSFECSWIGNNSSLVSSNWSQIDSVGKVGLTLSVDPMDLSTTSSPDKLFLLTLGISDTSFTLPLIFIMLFCVDFFALVTNLFVFH